MSIVVPLPRPGEVGWNGIPGRILKRQTPGACDKSSAVKVSLPQMRLIATGALIFCAVMMTVCRLLEPLQPWLVWPRSFFEAATVGAMADWFAVVALFRHPMGLPIPHTAILPKNKGRVGESLATFLETSFLNETQLGPRFRGIDYAGYASGWLAQHAGMLAEKASRFVPHIVDGISDGEIASLLGDRVRDFLRSAEMGPMVGEGLEVVVQNGRDREIFVSVLKAAHQLIEDHRGTIQSKISKEIPLSSEMLGSLPFGKELVGPLLDQWRESLAGAVAGKTIEKVQAALDEASREPGNVLWISFDKRLHEFINTLKSSPGMAARIRGMQESLAESQVVADFSIKAAQELKAFVLRDCAADDSAIRRKLEESIVSASHQLSENESARSGINAFVGEQVLAWIIASRHQSRQFVISTIEKWDGKEMAARLEATVGRDLQFIRLNGTIVGGIIGVLIHAAFAAIGR